MMCFKLNYVSVTVSLVANFISFIVSERHHMRCDDEPTKWFPSLVIIDFCVLFFRLLQLRSHHPRSENWLSACENPSTLKIFLILWAHENVYTMFIDFMSASLSFTRLFCSNLWGSFWWWPHNKKVYSFSLVQLVQLTPNQNGNYVEKSTSF